MTVRATALFAAAVLAACSPQSEQNTASPSSPAADGKGVKLLNVSYDVARDFYN